MKLDRLRAAVATVLMLICVPSLASAQAKKGDKELLLFGNLDTFLGGGNGISGSGDAFLNIGKFISDQTEVGGGPDLLFSAGGGFNVTVGANGFLRKYMKRKDPKVAPYYGAEASAVDFKNFSTTFFVSGIGGLKNYLSEKAALDVKGSVGLNPIHPSLIIIQITVGLTYVF
jgi:hypothetical protein